VLLSRDMSVVPTQGLGSGLRTCTTCSRNVLDEGAAVYDVCEWARLRKVELPRVRLDQHVGQMMASSALPRNDWLSGTRMARELELVGFSSAQLSSATEMDDRGRQPE